MTTVPGTSHTRAGGWPHRLGERDSYTSDIESDKCTWDKSSDKWTRRARTVTRGPAIFLSHSSKYERAGGHIEGEQWQMHLKEKKHACIWSSLAKVEKGGGNRTAAPKRRALKEHTGTVTPKTSTIRLPSILLHAGGWVINHHAGITIWSKSSDNWIPRHVKEMDVSNPDIESWSWNQNSAKLIICISKHVTGIKQEQLQLVGEHTWSSERGQLKPG